MTDQQDALDAAARVIWGSVELSGKLTHHGMTHGDDEVESAARRINDHAQIALGILINALGARRPGLQVSRDTLPLELLNTPATRDLVAALETAHTIACQVDEERGWVDEDGEAIGFGETLGGMLLGLRREVYGAKGSGME